MKKVILLIAVAFICILKAQAQNDTVLYVNQIQNSQTVNICLNKYGRAVICAPEECSEFLWQYTDDFGNLYESNESSIILDGNLSEDYTIEFYPYNNCSQHKLFVVIFMEPNVPAEATTELWKRQFEPTVLSVPYYGYSYQWNTGETTGIIEVTEPGTYTCGVSDMCATSVQTFIVRDNVELYRATVDLATNLNKATWQTTPAQAQYISQVRVERDGLVVGTVPYTQGYFMDNIGSENAARNYRLTGILTDGTDCPISSYQKGTLSTFYSPDVSDPNMVNMSWDIPYIEEGSPCSVTYFQICKYDVYTGELTVIDQLGANVHFGKYDMDLFDGDYGVVAALFNDGRRDFEELSFSNRSAQEILNVNEQTTPEYSEMKIYPNPSNGSFVVEGASTLTVYNSLGQIITTSKSEDGTHTFTLSSGIYFVKSDEGIVQKVVVE